ncbi:MAG: hypothetical protein AB7J32_14105 [Pseudonocardia sp.]
MSPREIAESSQLVVSSYKELVQGALSLRNDDYRGLMLDILRDPRITFPESYRDDGDREEVRAELVRAGYLEEGYSIDLLLPRDNLSPQAYISAPQSHEDWYNCHPGGLAITCAVNSRLSEYHTMLYQHRYGVPVDRDLALAALTIHEYPKAWIYAWNADGSYRKEPRAMGGNLHTHTLHVVAEMLHRGAPTEMVIAVAACHAFGSAEFYEDEAAGETRVRWPGYAAVASFLHGGAILARTDPVERGILERGSDGQLHLRAQPVEIWNCNLSDMNWPYTIGAAHTYTFPLLAELASSIYGIGSPETAEFRQLKNYVYAQVGQIALYELLVRDGREAVADVVSALVGKD